MKMPSCGLAQRLLNQWSCNPQNVCHAIHTRLLLSEVFSGSQGAAGKNTAIMGQMAQRNSFTVTDEVCRMVADYIAHAQGMYANFAFFRADRCGLHGRIHNQRESGR